MKIISRLALTISGIGFLNAMTITPVATQEIALDALCYKFPNNSDCQNKNRLSIESSSKTRQHEIRRDVFCQKFPLNSRCEGEPFKVIKLNLARSGEDNEWIRIEQKGNKVKLIHTNKVKQGLVSDIIDGAMDLVDLSIPILFDTNVYKWEDHQVNRVAFKSDRCARQKCIVKGRETLKLPPRTNIYQGVFTIQYREKDLARSLSFRIPTDVESETADTIVVDVPD